MGSSKKKNGEKTTRGEAADSVVGSKKVIDPRFESVKLDPRFVKQPKHKAKVTIDSRFNHMFTNKNFSSSSTAQIDKKGKAKKDSSRDALKHYYRLEEKEERKEQKLKEEEQVESDEEKSSVDLSDLDSETDSDEEDESKDESSDDDTEEEDDGFGLSSVEEENTFVQEENVPEINKETNRLAVVNLDWMQVTVCRLSIVNLVLHSFHLFIFLVVQFNLYEVTKTYNTLFLQWKF